MTQWNDYASDNLEFAVMGDSRGYGKDINDQINEKVFTTILRNLKKYHHPEFILFGGDMISGRWTHGIKPCTCFMVHWLKQWRDIVKNVFPEVNIEEFLYPCIGNHDISCDIPLNESEKAFNMVFDYLPPGKCCNEMLEGYGKTVYYFDYGNTRFIVLNSRWKNVDTDITTVLYGIPHDQQVWLKEVLRRSDKAHNFIMFHVPIFGSVNRSSINPYQRESLCEILGQNNISGVFVGHEHLYCRRVISNALFYEKNKLVVENRFNQLTVGSCGAPLYPGGDSNENCVFGPLGVYHYMIVNIVGDTVSYKVYDLNENCIDSFIL